MTDMDKILSEECSKVQEVALSVSGRGIGKEEELKVNDNEPEEKKEENANTINLEEVGEVLRNQEEELAHQNNVIMILKMQNNKLKEKLKEIKDHQSKRDQLNKTKLKNEDDFINEVAETQLKNIELVEQVKKIEDEYNKLKEENEQMIIKITILQESKTKAKKEKINTYKNEVKRRN